MQLLIRKGRIQIELEGVVEDDLLATQDRLLATIGSANPVKGYEGRRVSCALSPENFRKLKREGARIARDPETGVKDPHTLKIIEKLRGELDKYERESALGGHAKNGFSVFSGYATSKGRPYDHQIVGIQFLHAIPEAALFGDCGTGKTAIVSWFAESLIQAGERYIFLIVCPVNLIEHVWVDDITKFTNISCVGLREPKAPSILKQDWEGLDKENPEDKKKASRRAKARIRKLLEARFESDVDAYIINPENIRTDPKETRVLNLLKRKRKEGYEVCLVVDESSKIKSKQSRTYKALRRIRALCSRAIIMSGTPSPNGILDLWAQFHILDGGKTLQPSYTDYRHDVARERTLKNVSWEDKQGNTRYATKWQPKPGAAKVVHSIISPRMIRFRTDECIDLPPSTFITRHVDMSEAQREAYDDMSNMLFTELEGDTVTAKVAASKLTKLREITGGFVITDEGEAKALCKDAPKMLELDELLEQSISEKLGDEGPPQKAIIWAQYRWECKSLVKRYAQRYGARGLFGGVSSHAKDKHIREFKNDPSRRLLVCHPASVGHGLTLTEANFVFYYSLSHNFEEFYQSYRRNKRPGQKRHTTYYLLVTPKTIDAAMLQALAEKKNLSDMITDGQFQRDDFLKMQEADGAQLDLSWDFAA